MSSFFRKYELTDQIGEESSYGVVFQAIDKETKQKVAVKTFAKNRFAGENRKLYITNILREQAIHLQLNHNFIVQALEFHENDDTYFLVMDLCETTLTNELAALNKNKTDSSVTNYLEYFRQLIDVMNFLEGLKLEININGQIEVVKGVSHCDLKPSNIFIQNNMIKLGDFGTWKNNSQTRGLLVDGTPLYMALELLKSKESRMDYSQEKADVWSAGVILFEIAYGFYPFTFKGSNQDALVNQIEKCKYHIMENLPEKKYVGKELKYLISKMLHPDPEQRFDWKQVKENRRISFVYKNSTIIHSYISTSTIDSNLKSSLGQLEFKNFIFDLKEKITTLKSRCLQYLDLSVNLNDLQEANFETVEQIVAEIEDNTYPLFQQKSRAKTVGLKKMDQMKNQMSDYFQNLEKKMQSLQTKVKNQKESDGLLKIYLEYQCQLDWQIENFVNKIYTKLLEVGVRKRRRYDSTQTQEFILSKSMLENDKLMKEIRLIWTQ